MKFNFGKNYKKIPTKNGFLPEFDRFLEYLMVIGSVFGTEGDAISNGFRPLNFKGRCAFGMPCDHRRISYGCEKKIGVCWSECVGTLDKTFGTGHFQYEGKIFLGSFLGLGLFWA